MMDKLKLCPFCGGKATIHNDAIDEHWSPSFCDPDSGGSRHKTVSCHSCHFSIDAYETQIEAIEAWNRRAT